MTKRSSEPSPNGPAIDISTLDGDVIVEWEFDTFRVSNARAAELTESLTWAVPVPMVLHCPKCFTQHVDQDEFATRPHRTHRCVQCAHEWRPANVYTVGVAAIEDRG